MEILCESVLDYSKILIARNVRITLESDTDSVGLSVLVVSRIAGIHALCARTITWMIAEKSLSKGSCFSAKFTRYIIGNIFQFMFLVFRR